MFCLFVNVGAAAHTINETRVILMKSEQQIDTAMVPFKYRSVNNIFFWKTIEGVSGLF